MGNPPFNKPQEGTRKGSYGGRTLWDKFVVNIINYIKTTRIFSISSSSRLEGIRRIK